jgi:arylsulfatase A-like enzyme
MSGRPNVILILADDLGFSDLGCYGGEIRTPALDRLAKKGVRASRFYATSRCSPSRASLLTGLHPHQTGIGILTNDDRPFGYPGNLNDRCVTMAELLRAAGWATCLSGKWHLCHDIHTPNDAWPTRRGFERFFGTLVGCGSFYHPGTLTRGEESADRECLDPEFFYTDAIAKVASAFIREHRAAKPSQPFFLYTAFTAPHWPLHAHEEGVRAYDGVFDEGWDVLRARRMERLREMGLISLKAVMSDRDPLAPAWRDAPHKPWQVRRMQAYAAQISRMDRGIGQIIAALEDTGSLDDTFLVFLSDNGPSAEELPKGDLARFRQRKDILRLTTRDGREVHIGNDPSVMPGGEDTYASYGRGWANLSNTPFRLYKEWTHEGGIAEPFIVHWPRGGLAAGRVIDTPHQLTHVLPTILEITGAEYDRSFAGRQIPPLEGKSMLPALRGESVKTAALYWEHIGNAAIRRDHWKLVREHGRPWELYDIESDPTERNDLVQAHPDVVAELSAEWTRWSERAGVIPFDRTLEGYRARGLGWMEAAG